MNKILITILMGLAAFAVFLIRVNGVRNEKCGTVNTENNSREENVWIERIE